MSRRIWIVALFVTTLLLIVKAALILFSSHLTQQELIVIAAFIIFLYIMFLTEGGYKAASKLHTNDHYKTELFARETLSGPSLAAVLGILPKIFKNYDDIAIGRQIVLLVVIVVLATLIDEMHVPEHNMVSNILCSFDINCVNVEGSIQSVMNGWFTNIVLSALVPCWFAQIPPEMLAGRNAVAFLGRVPASCIWLSFLIKISRIGAGIPGEIIHNNLQKFGQFTPDNIQLGDKTIFQRAASSFGHHVSKRSISIKSQSNKISITDSSVVEYTSGRHYTLSNSLSVYLPHSVEIKLINFEGTSPPNLVRTNWSMRTLGSNITSSDGGDPIKETTYHAETTLDTPIPTSNCQNQCKFLYHYEADKLSYDDDKVDVFCFDITKPTEVVTIYIEYETTMMIILPIIKMQPVDEARKLGERHFRELKSEIDYTINHSPGKYIINIPYLTNASRYLLSLDARIADVSQRS